MFIVVESITEWDWRLVETLLYKINKKKRIIAIE